MASDYSIRKERFDEYLKNNGDFADIRVVAQMQRDLQWANTWDPGEPKIRKKASEILNGNLIPDVSTLATIKATCYTTSKEQNMKTVFFQGSFDILNVGHIRAFERARSLGDRLIVGLNSDRVIREDKNHDPILPYIQRLELVKAVRWVDEVIECDGIYALPYLKALEADVFVLTREWEHRHTEALAWMKETGGEVFFSPRWPDIYPSSEIRRRVIEGAA